MTVKKIIVDEIPKNCGDCIFMRYVCYDPECCALHDDIGKIEGNPYAMTYRRSDCPLEEREQK